MSVSRSIAATALLLSTLALALSARAADWMRTDDLAPPLPSGALLSASADCTFGSLGSPLTLEEAVERALCGQPKTRQAWLGVKAQAAGVGAARAAYLPTANLQWQVLRDRSSTSVDEHPELSSGETASPRSGTVSANWVLYDFGARRAALDSAWSLLDAAKANHQVVLQTTFAAVAKDYYAAQGALGALTTAEQVTRMAESAAEASRRRVEKGVAPISDQLQAETALAQAVVARAKAHGEWRTAVGVLATDMTLEPDTGVDLPEVVDGSTSLPEFEQAIGNLIREAKRTHPSVLAAAAQVDAADAKARELRAQGRPTLSLVAKDSRNDQPVTSQLGGPRYAATSRDAYLGVQITIPLFEGYVRRYRVQEAELQGQAQRAVADDARQRVGSEVWQAYQTLRTNGENLANTAALLEISQRAHGAAEKRYGVGVGSILELLNAQNALANAQRQRTQSLIDWRAARLQLASALGTLTIENARRDAAR